MSVDLRLLTVMTRSGPSGNVMFHVWPDIQFRDQAMRGVNSRGDKECRLSNTARHIVEGIRGRGRRRPWETSQGRVLLECGIGTCFSCKEVEEVKRFLRSSSWLWATARVSRLTGDCSSTRTLWDSASATGLARPSMWRMSFVNSEIKARCRGCRCLLYTSPSPRDLSTSRMPSSA